MLVTTAVALKLPVVAGAKLRFNVQLAFGARVGRQLLDSGNDPLLAPFTAILENVTVDEPLLVMVIGYVGLVVPAG